MTAPLTEKELAEALARADAATPGPWHSSRDGNQFIETGYPPTAKLVGASRVLGVVRPWNPHALVAFGFKPSEYETVRLLDADADFVAATRTDVPRLIADLRAARALLREWLNEHREGNCEASMLARVEAALPPEDP